MEAWKVLAYFIENLCFLFSWVLYFYSDIMLQCFLFIFEGTIFAFQADGTTEIFPHSPSSAARCELVNDIDMQV